MIPPRNRTLSVLAVLSILPLAAACTATSQSGNASQSGNSGKVGGVVTIGAVQPLSGPLSALGKYSLEGVEMAVDLVNSEGGIDGKKVKLLTVDAPNVQDTSTQVRRLVQSEGVKLVVGTYGSSQAITAAATATRFGAFYFEVNSASADIVKKSAPYSVKIPWTIPDIVVAAPKFLKTTLAGEIGKPANQLRVALIHEDGAFGGGVAQLLPDGLRGAGLSPLVESDAYTAGGTQDFTPIINRLKLSKPDVLLAASYLDDAQLFIRQAEQQGLKIPVISGVTAGFADPALPSKVPASALNGIYVMDSNPLVKTGLSDKGAKLREEMLSLYKKYDKVKPPVSHTAYAFLGTYVVLKYILPGVDISDRKAILDKAMALNVPLGDLPMGFGVKFGAENDPVHPHINERTLILLNQWQNGKLVAVGPKEFREAVPLVKR